MTEAEGEMDKSNEKWWESELLRVRGELLLTSKDNAGQSSQEAEACFQRAIQIAQSQQAKSLELRTSIRLAQLWRDSGKQDEAHQLLSDIYGWFSEGLETSDLQTAKALRDELAPVHV